MIGRRQGLSILYSGAVDGRIVGNVRRGVPGGGRLLVYLLEDIEGLELGEGDGMGVDKTLGCYQLRINILRPF